MVELLLEDVEAFAPVTLHPSPMTDEQFIGFCERYEGFRIESTATGEIEILPPAGFETGYRNNQVARLLGNWAEQDGRGRAFDSNTLYRLPSGARRSPDASWVANERIDVLSRREKEGFAPLAPDFVIEIVSPSDRLTRVHAKMREWIESGVTLGWMLDPTRRQAYIYRQTQPPEELAEPANLHGEGPVAGFTLELAEIWRGLKSGRSD